MNKAFFDTNIIVYAFVQNDFSRSRKAREILENYAVADLAVISTNVLNETFYTAVRKHKFSRADARKVVHHLSCLKHVVVPNVEDVLIANDIAVETQFTIYDALMIASAKFAGCDRIYTEDLTHNQIVRGIRIINPFFE
jgi:predicted nucleic acid-binding protein